MWIFILFLQEKQGTTFLPHENPLLGALEQLIATPVGTPWICQKPYRARALAFWQ